MNPPALPSETLEILTIDNPSAADPLSPQLAGEDHAMRDVITNAKPRGGEDQLYLGTIHRALRLGDSGIVPVFVFGLEG